jgi:UMF1 family MFS transporter
MKKRSLLPLFAWALYDWAMSPFSVIIQTFVFAAYFVKSVASDPTYGSAQWGFVMGLAGVIVAAISPIAGAAADQGGKRKIWLAAFTLLCVITTALLWFIKPSPAYVVPALVLLALGTIGSEGAYIFYNAMLPDLTAPNQIGRWSGWGWAMGYAGGVVSLILVLEAFVKAKNPWIALDGALDEPVRAAFLLTAAWYAIFALPIFFFTPEMPSKGKTFRQAAADGLRQVWTTILQVRQYKDILRFFIAKLFYIDGLATLFAFGGIFATTAFKMNPQEVLLFGIAMNVSAGIGAGILALMDDIFGARKMILLSLACLILFGAVALSVKTKTLFWVFSLLLALFVGPVQASSRSYLARVAPAHLRNQMFGFYMLSGKATAFMGPLLLGWITYFSGSLRLGMGSVLLFFAVGAAIMWRIPSDLESPAK